MNISFLIILQRSLLFVLVFTSVIISHASTFMIFQKSFHPTKSMRMKQFRRWVFHSQSFIQRDRSNKAKHALNMMSKPIVKDFDVVSTPAVGRILLAKPFEYNHYLMKGSVLIVQHDETGSKGLLLDKATAFEMGEMVPSMATSPFRGNKLFTGGEQGPNSIVMLHRHGNLDGSSPVAAGLYLGGRDHAEEFVSVGELPAEDFKFFFNYVGFQPGQLEEQVQDGQWDVLDLEDPDFVLYQNHNDNMWSVLRNKMISSRQSKNNLQ